MEFDLLGSLDPHHSRDTAPSPEAHAAPHATCSRRGCRAPASWSLSWNNPRVHTPERRKTWLACDAHREHLAEFLDQRGFLKAVEPFAPHDDAAPTPGGDGGVVRGERTEGTR
ncbi:hypothetical protein [Kocuria sp.]|uniref:hypothetical protein n=1 Tax=Kocuria sp. TaxID=1871328 RepID=UPI0026DAE6E9|nr:hypothetical protein [Kocuria sp.]MDO4919703.1 hypothetical protein [Kocuria sp.]